MEEQTFPRVIPTAPLHAGKRKTNKPFLQYFKIPFLSRLAKNGISTPTPNQIQTPQVIPLPTDPPVRNADLFPFEENVKEEILNFIHPESTILRFSIFFFILSLISISSFLFEFHPEIFLLLSVLFFSLAAYPVAKILKKKLKKKASTEDSQEESIYYKTTNREIKNNKKPSEMFIEMYGKDNQNQDQNSNNDMYIELYPQFKNADRPFASLKKDTGISTSQDTQIETLVSNTLSALNIKPKDFHQYNLNLKNFIVKSILSKIDLTSSSAYRDMMLSVPNHNSKSYDQKFVIQRIRELSVSSYLAGHLAENGDNQIVLHILSVWLSYLMTKSKEDKRPPLVFSQKYLVVGDKEPKLESDNDLFFIANKEYTSFYVLTRSTNKAGADDSNSIGRYYFYPGKDSMYSTLTLFFYLVKDKFDNLLDGADLSEPPFCMNSIFEPTHLA